MHTPPARVNFHERRFAGIPWRDAGILVFSALTALALFVLFPHIPFIPKAIGAVVTVAFGAGVAFFRPEGLTVEQWLLEVLSFRRRTRYRLKGVLKHGAGARVQMPDQTQESEPEPEPLPVVEPISAISAPLPTAVAGVLVAQPTPLGAAVLLVTLFMFSVLVSLTLYLVNGGADRLYSLLKAL